MAKQFSSVQFKFILLFIQISHVTYTGTTVAICYVLPEKAIAMN